MSTTAEVRECETLDTAGTDGCPFASTDTYRGYSWCSHPDDQRAMNLSHEKPPSHCPLRKGDTIVHLGNT